MTSRMASQEGCTSGSRELVYDTIETDTLVEAQLAELESLLERKGDAALGLSQLHELRRSCRRIKEFISKVE